MKYLLVLTAFVSTIAMADPSCLAQLDRTDGKRIEERALTALPGYPGGKKWEGELGAGFFSVTHDAARDDYLLLITRGPAYQDGLAVRGDFNKRGELRASLVTPEITFRVVCTSAELRR